MHHQIRQLAQPVGAVVEVAERCVRPKTLFFGHSLRPLDAVDGRECDFMLLRIFSGGLAQLLRRALHVENVVDNLEGETHMFAVASDGSQLLVVSAGINGSEAHARAQQRAGFRAVDSFEQTGARALALAFEIVHLAGDHASRGARRSGQLLHEAHAPARVHFGRFRQDLESQRQKRVAGQDGNRFAKGLMTSGAAAAEVIVVKGRQIVMNQGVGMNHLERAGDIFYAPREVRNGLRAGDAQQRPYPFASREYAVAHGSKDDFGRGGFRRNPPVERRVDDSLLLAHVFVERHVLSLPKGCGVTLSPRRVRISTRVSASSSCFRQDSLSSIPFSNSAKARSSGRSPLSISLTIFSSSSRPASKLWGFSDSGINFVL